MDTDRLLEVFELTGNFTQSDLDQVYVGDPHAMPVVNLPTHEGWEWENVIRHGDVVQEILASERERAVDLLVMTTQGHDGFLDALRGSTTERVLRGARCPLLAIPAPSKDATGA